MLASSEVHVRLVFRSSGDPTRKQALGAYEIESLIDPGEESAGTVYRVTIAPGTTTTRSYHARAEEYYFVLRGRGTAHLDDQEIDVRAGDFLRLPPGTAHGFSVSAEGLELLNVHTPGCRPDIDTFPTA